MAIPFKFDIFEIFPIYLNAANSLDLSSNTCPEHFTPLLQTQRYLLFYYYYYYYLLLFVNIKSEK